MVTIISTNKTGSYRLLKRATYSDALQAYLYQTVAEKRSIILIYDIHAKKQSTKHHLTMSITKTFGTNLRTENS